jgi:hypothetical protein
MVATRATVTHYLGLLKVTVRSKVMEQIRCQDANLHGYGTCETISMQLEASQGCQASKIARDRTSQCVIL